MATLLSAHWKLALLWALSLVAVGAVTTTAQRGGQPGFPAVTVSPTLVFGNDVGFRIERTQDGIPVGRLVVRIDGRWIDTAAPTPTR